MYLLITTQPVHGTFGGFATRIVEILGNISKYRSFYTGLFRYKIIVHAMCTSTVIHLMVT